MTVAEKSANVPHGSGLQDDFAARASVFLCEALSDLRRDPELHDCATHVDADALEHLEGGRREVARARRLVRVDFSGRTVLRHLVDLGCVVPCRAAIVPILLE
jgi:hypothetical protein